LLGTWWRAPTLTPCPSASDDRRRASAASRAGFASDDALPGLVPSRYDHHFLRVTGAEQQVSPPSDEGLAIGLGVGLPLGILLM